MSIRSRLIFVFAGAFILSTVLAACSDRPTTVQIVETTKAQNKLDNAQATRQAVIDAGGDPDEQVQVEIDSNSAAAKAIEEQNAKATAQAEKGIVFKGVGSAIGEESEGAAFEVEVPGTPAESGTIVVAIEVFGAEGTKFVPDIVKITVGSTVKWTNARKAASSSQAHHGQAEEWDSKALFKGTFDKEPDSFEHTFTTEGCFTYQSRFSGDTNTGAVCVVAE